VGNYDICIFCLPSVPGEIPVVLGDCMSFGGAIDAILYLIWLGLLVASTLAIEIFCMFASIIICLQNITDKSFD
jgi:hypothetical protein